MKSNENSRWTDILFTMGDDYKMATIGIIGIVILFIAGFIAGTFIDIEKSKTERAAIEAGLVQEVIQGEKVWVEKKSNNIK